MRMYKMNKKENNKFSKEIRLKLMSKKLKKDLGRLRLQWLKQPMKVKWLRKFSKKIS